jgi:hypothetical protein
MPFNMFHADAPCRYFKSGEIRAKKAEALPHHPLQVFGLAGQFSSQLAGAGGSDRVILFCVPTS